MVHDDRRGVGEPLSEPGLDGKGLVVRARHFVILDNIQNSTFLHRSIAEMMMMQWSALLVSDSGNPADYIQKYMTNVSKFSTQV